MQIAKMTPETDCIGTGVLDGERQEGKKAGI
jgi:hypothetical protein